MKTHYFLCDLRITIILVWKNIVDRHYLSKIILLSQSFYLNKRENNKKIQVKVQSQESPVCQKNALFFTTRQTPPLTYNQLMLSKVSYANWGVIFSINTFKSCVSLESNTVRFPDCTSKRNSLIINSCVALSL